MPCEGGKPLRCLKSGDLEEYTLLDYATRDDLERSGDDRTTGFGTTELPPGRYNSSPTGSLTITCCRGCLT
jgi:hypothetical protein